MTLPELRQQLAALPVEEAIHRLSDYITGHPDDDEAYILRGLRYWAINKRALAINDYQRALNLNPRSTRARAALDQANDILDFFNKDMLNP